MVVYALNSSIQEPEVIICFFACAELPIINLNIFEFLRKILKSSIKPPSLPFKTVSVYTPGWPRAPYPFVLASSLLRLLAHTISCCFSFLLKVVLKSIQKID